MTKLYNFRIKNTNNFRKQLKQINYCYVCGKRIPLFGGRVAHRGECLTIYHSAVSSYQHCKAKC